MSTIKEIDKNVLFTDQLESSAAPIVMLNIFQVDENDVDAFLRHWAVSARFMRSQNGFISQQLHKGVGASLTFMNYGVWESVSALKVAFYSSEFGELRNTYPNSAVAMPHLFQTVSVPGNCIGMLNEHDIAMMRKKS
jgi:quinol monooxygenase YgiN